MVRRASLLALLVAAAAGGAYPFLGGWRSGRTVVVEPLSRQDSRRIWAQDRTPASGDWTKVYRFRREISAKSGEKAILDFDLRGTLELMRQGAWVRASFHLDKSRQYPAIDSAIPFYFSMNAEGEITEIRSSGDADQQSILKDLAFLFAYRTRLDTAGEVEMSVREVRAGAGSGDSVELLKQKSHYLGPIGKLVRIKKSEHRIRQDLSLLAGIEITEMGRIETSSRYQLKLEKSASVAGEPINPALVAQYAALPLLSPEGATTAAGEGRPVVSWRALKSQLSRIGKAGSAHRMKLFHELIRTLRQDPQALGEFKDWMSSRRRAGQEGHRDFVYGLGVLGGVGTPEAQSEMMRFHHEHSDPAVLNALTTMTAPFSSDTREFLKELTGSKVESEAIPALLALGSSLRPREGATDDDGAVELILARYREARRVSQKMEVLDAMGNSGNIRFLPTITSVIRDPKAPELLVTKAIFALRLMKQDEARSLLSQLAGDELYQPYKGVILSALSHLPSRGKL